MNSKVDRPEKFDESVSHIPIETWFQLLQMGSWKLNLRTNKLLCSPETLNLLGFPKNLTISVDDWLKLVHSDDLQLFKQFINLVGEPQR